MPTNHDQYETGGQAIVNHESEENCNVNEVLTTNEAEPDENEDAGENESHQNNEVKQHMDHKDNATLTKHDTIKTMQRSDRQRDTMLDILSTSMPKKVTKLVTKHPWMWMDLTMSLEPRFLNMFWHNAA